MVPWTSKKPYGVGTTRTVSLSAVGQALELVARRGKPVEFARAITGNDALNGDDIQVEKLEVIFIP